MLTDSDSECESPVKKRRKRSSSRENASDDDDIKKEPITAAERRQQKKSNILSNLENVSGTKTTIKCGPGVDVVFFQVPLPVNCPEPDQLKRHKP